VVGHPGGGVGRWEQEEGDRSSSSTETVSATPLLPLANDAAALDFDSVVFVVGVGSSPAWVLVSRRVETAFSKSSSLLAGVDVDEIGAREGELDEEDDDDEAGLARAARRRSEVGAAEDGGACEGGVGNCAG
jgi:hypothetical protein